VAYLARVVSGWMIKDVARHFRLSPMVMSQEGIRIEGKLGKDHDLRETIEKLKTDLTQNAKEKTKGTSYIVPVPLFQLNSQPRSLSLKNQQHHRHRCEVKTIQAGETCRQASVCISLHRFSLNPICPTY
jgi:hypothetical protein